MQAVVGLVSVRKGVRVWLCHRGAEVIRGILDISTLTTLPEVRLALLQTIWRGGRHCHGCFFIPHSVARLARLHVCPVSSYAGYNRHQSQCEKSKVPPRPYFCTRFTTCLTPKPASVDVSFPLGSTQLALYCARSRALAMPTAPVIAPYEPGCVHLNIEHCLLVR